MIGGLYLAPFAGIMFLWFVAVIRDQIGEREDRFFATVFFGSGLLFVALLFAAAAVVSTPTTLVQFLGQTPPSVESIVLMRALAYTLLFAFGTRGAAVFMLATATIGIRSGVFPRWFALVTLPARVRPARGGLVRRLGDPGAAGVGRRGEPVHPPAGEIAPADTRSRRVR